MTSVNMKLDPNRFSTDKIKKRSAFAQQADMLGRRLWTIGIVVLYLVIYYPVAAVMLISRSNNNAVLNNPNITKAAMRAQRIQEISTWIGVRADFNWVIVILAILVGISGFSFVFSRQKMDFFESQPVTRAKRFREVYLNGILIFTVPYVVCVMAAILIAFGMDAMNGVVLKDCLVQFIHLFLTYCSAYSFAVLAVMLCGRVFISICVAAFMMIAEFFYAVVLQMYASNFFATYAGDAYGKWMLSPLYNTMAVLLTGTRGSTYSQTAMSGQLLSFYIKAIVPADAALVITGIAAAVFAFVLYKKRQTEWAGSSIVFRPVAVLIKIITGTGAALFAGIMTAAVFNVSYVGRAGDMRKNVIFFMIFAMFAAGIIISGVIQTVYTQDARRFFSRPFEMLAVCGAALVIFLTYRYDLTGYDRYIPKVSSVESAAVSFYDGSSYTYYDDLSPTDILTLDDNAQQHMFLKNIDAVEALAEPAMKYTRETALSDVEGYYATIIYRLRNGRVEKRNVYIPYDIDASLMDAVTGSMEYKKAVCPLFSSVDEKKGKDSSWQYTNGIASAYGESGSDDDFAEGFETAYLEDLKNDCYSKQKKNDTIGAVTVAGSRTDWYQQSYPVFPYYTNTIAYLKKAGIWEESAADSAPSVAGVTVNYYDDNGGSTYKTYDDKAKMAEILRHVVCTSFSQLWMTDDETEPDYGVTVQSKKTSTSNSAGVSYIDAYSFSFKKDEIPTFVKEDLRSEQGSTVQGVQ